MVESVPTEPPVTKTKAPTPVFIHRAGFTRSETTPNGEALQNSIPRAQETFRVVQGAEIDVTFTKDGAAVVTHDDVSKLTLEEFKKQYPDHATLDAWVTWLQTEPMKDKQVYLDLKGTKQDPYKLLETVSALGERISIGSKDPVTVTKLLLARKLLRTNNKIYLQIPDPAVPDLAIAYANNLVENAGLGDILNNGKDEEKEMINDLRPDGLHFYFPENLAKDIVSEMKGHGEFVPLTDPQRTPTAKRFPNIPIFHNIQRLRLGRFTRLAKQKGYEVIAGSAASPLTMQRMIEWGVDAIMPNDPSQLPPGAANEQKTDTSIPKPANMHESTHDVWEHALGAEMRAIHPNQNPKRYAYLRMATRMRPISAIRQQLGI